MVAVVAGVALGTTGVAAAEAGAHDATAAAGAAAAAATTAIGEAAGRVRVRMSVGAAARLRGVCNACAWPTWDHRVISLSCIVWDVTHCPQPPYALPLA